MNDSNLKKEIENKVKEVLNKEEKTSGDEFDLIDVTDETPSVTKSATESIKEGNSDYSRKDEFLDEVPKVFKDAKGGKDQKINRKESLKPGGKLDDKSPLKNNVKDDLNQLKNNVKEDLKPIKEDLKKGANDLKEAGKKAASKAGGAALASATGGVIPPKVGEFVTKKSLDKIEKGGKKKLNRAKNNFNRRKNQLNNKANKIKEKGSEKLDNLKRKGEKAVNNTVKTVKAIKFIRFIKKYGVVIASVLGIGLIVAAFIGLIAVLQTYVPGLFGNVNDDKTDSVAYSKRDTEILENIGNIVRKYPGVGSDGAAIVMATVSYPHHTLLQSDNVKTLLGNSPDNEGDEIDEKIDDENDMYLTMYKKDKFLNKFEELLKVYNDSQRDGFNNYLKTNYFLNDDGYKKLFKHVDETDKDELIIEIQKDIEENASFYRNYIIDSRNNGEICFSNLQSIGYFDDLGLINGEAAIILKDTSASDFASIKAATSLYGTDDLHLDLKRYVLGVTYAEVGEWASNEQMAKAEMIAAKSFVLGRTAPGSSETVGMGYKTDYKEGKTVFYMRGNTYDQGFCDIYEGCQPGSKYAKNLIINDPTGETHNNVKPPLSSAEIANFEKWYDETAGEFIFDDKNKAFNGTQYNDFNSRCKKGSCMSQEEAHRAAQKGSDYIAILFDLSYSEKRFTLYNAETKSVAAVTTECSSIASTCGIENRDFIYYSQKVGKFSEANFCNVSGAMIKNYGCGITSMAMVIANLADSSVTPLVTNSEATSGGYCGSYGTSGLYFSEAAKKYNLNISQEIKTNSTDTTKSADKIINTIRQGGLVIINVNSSWLNGGSGHYIVAKGLDSKGNLVIADPYADSLQTPVRNNVSAKKVIEDYVNNGFGWYMFTSDKSKEIVEKYCKNDEEDSNVSGDWVRPNNYKLADIKKKFGPQRPMACFSAADTYGAWISIRKDTISLFRRVPGPSASAFGATYAKLSSDTEVYKKIIEEVNKGHAVALHGGRTNGSTCKEHWVTAVGYKRGFNVNNVQNMTAKDILTIDPADANEKTLDKSLPNGLCTSTARSWCAGCYNINYWK